jgi:MSHA biogenesis protein MshM
MYEEHFGLNRPPFKITPDTSLFFDGGKRREILGALLYTIQRGEGIVKVVGEVGSGKTMLCRMLQQELPQSVEIIYIANPSVSAEDILFVMAHELELPVSKQNLKHEVMHLLQDYLVQRHTENKQVVLFIEEAQGMPLETLEEIRLLSNLETDQHKLLQIILFGQPELDDNLALQSIRQLRERITHTFELQPLSNDEIYQYLNFRMREVGYKGPELITPALAKKIERYSGGLLRRINIMADKLLLSAFAEGTHNLTANHVLAAAMDSGFLPMKKNKNVAWLGLALLFVAVLVTSLYLTRTQWLDVVAGEPADKVTQDKNGSAKVAANPIENVTNITEPAAAQSEIIKPLELANAETLAGQIDAELEVSVASLESIENATALTVSTAPEPIDNSSAVAPKLNLPLDDEQWLIAKIEQSKNWLANANQTDVSIQVMSRYETTPKEMARILRNRWPLDLQTTYLFGVQSESQVIYRIFYSEFTSVPEGTREIKKLPRSIGVNGPYLHSIYKMQAAFLD